MERSFTHRVVLAHVCIDLHYENTKLERTSSLKRAQELFEKTEDQDEKKVYFAQYRRVFLRKIDQKERSSYIAKIIEQSPDDECRNCAELKLYRNLTKMLKYKKPRLNISEFEIIKRAILGSDMITLNQKLQQKLDGIIIYKINQELIFNIAHEQICRERFQEKISTDEEVRSTADMLAEIISDLKNIKSSRLLELYFSFPRLAIIYHFNEDYPCLFSENELKTITEAVDDELIRRRFKLNLR